MDWSLKHLRQQYINYAQASKESANSAHDGAAAVLLPLQVRGDELHVILTKRAEDLPHHPGQICFPGGRHEPQDENLRHTALRETYEEIGVANELVEVWSVLPTIDTITGFKVTPYIGLIHSDSEFEIATAEVAELLIVPFQFFLDENNCVMQSTTYRNQILRYPVYSYNEHKIWGATARIMYDAIKLLN